jgi:hypothetical protein
MRAKFILLSLVLLFLNHTIFSQVVPGITSSNLPLVVINTNGLTIVDGSKIASKMKVIDNASHINKPSDPGNNFDGNIGIEYRGGKAKPAEQNPYTIETRDASGGNLNVSLLGMPEENDWILLANYNDKTLIRNALSLEIFRKMDHYSPRAKMVEVIVNNVYQGIYFLTEKIKQDKGRVDISKLTSADITGDAVTGGYIFKIDSYDATDSWKSSYTPIDHPEKPVYFVYDDPAASDLVAKQKTYLQSAVNSFEKVLYSSGYRDQTTGYPAWIKINSWLDYFIVSEFSRNINAYKKNCFYFKNKDSKDTKFHSGPVWDFDSGYKNLDACIPFSATDGSGWSYKINDCADNKTNSNGWIVRLLQDPAFASAVNARYTLMRNSYLSSTYLNNFIDSVQNLASEAQGRHYTKWNILSSAVGDAEVDAQPATYAGQVLKFKNWIQTRLAWLDVHIPSDITSVPNDRLDPEFSYRIFPNPSSDLIFIEASSKIQDIEIIQASGQSALHLSGLSAYETQVNVSKLTSGIYIVLVKMDDKQQVRSKLVIQ